MKKFFTNKTKNIFLFICIIAFVVLSIGSAFNESLTFDEIVYLQEGRQVLLHKTFSIDPYNPPLIKELAVLPYLFTKNFYHNALFHIQYSLVAKVIIIFLGINVLFITYGLTKKYIGEAEALFAVGLLSIEPTFLANSNLATLDMGLTLFFFVAYAIFISLFKKAIISSQIALAISIGLGLAAKLSFAPFFLISAICVASFTYGKTTIGKIWSKKTKIGLLLLLSLCVVWMVYWFHVSPIVKERQDNTRVSQKLIRFSLTHHIPFLGQIIVFTEKQGVPLGDFLAINKNTILRKPALSCFFLGTYYSSCLPYFLPVNFFLKLPLPFVIFLAASFGLFAVSREYRKKTTLFLIPFLVILIVGSFSRMQPLVRYVLPAYPFIAILAASSLHFWQKNLALKILFAGLCFWYVVSVFITFPHFLSYANEFAGYPSQRFLLLTDSNLDWGQSLPDVSHFVDSKKSEQILFSYFGRDNGDWYGLQSDKAYMSYKNPEICEFHKIANSQKQTILISSSNWYSCGYYKEKQFAKNKIKGILGDTILIF